MSQLFSTGSAAALQSALVAHAALYFVKRSGGGSRYYALVPMVTSGVPGLLNVTEQVATDMGVGANFNDGDGTMSLTSGNTPESVCTFLKQLYVPQGPDIVAKVLGD